MAAVEHRILFDKRGDDTQKRKHKQAGRQRIIQNAALLYSADMVADHNPPELPYQVSASTPSTISSS